MPNPATSPEETVSDILAAGTPLVAGTDLFFSPERPPLVGIMPHEATFCQATGGPAPSTYINEDEDFRILTVQVLTRGNVGEYVATIAIARASWTALQRATVSAGYFKCVVRESEVVALGKDDTEHPRFVNNIELWFKG